jgi:hypothetical protein
VYLSDYLPDQRLKDGSVVGELNPVEVDSTPVTVAVHDHSPVVVVM